MSPSLLSGGGCDVLYTVVGQNGELSDVMVFDILKSGHLPIVFHTLHHVRTINLSDPVKRFGSSKLF